jgi:3-oxoacid CoA-transferase B subunit
MSTAPNTNNTNNTTANTTDNNTAADPTERILRRAVQEITPGSIVNLGIGLPSQVLRYLPDDFEVQIHAENGLLGAWKQAEVRAMDPFLIDASGAYVSLRPGSSLFDSAVSFAMIRRGRLDLTMMGAFEVDAAGNLANWKIPGKFSPGIGGAMELAQKTPRIVVLTSHTDKRGQAKILTRCRLPLTAKACVNRIISELAVMDITPQGVLVREKLTDISDDDLQACTEARLLFGEDHHG